jgi:hypothetical protein
MPAFAEWSPFYSMVGETAGTLIGLQFIVMTLMAQTAMRLSPEGGSAYSTPTTIHFATAFFVCALLEAPWPALVFAAALLGAIGVGGMVYSVIVIRRIGRQSNYQPLIEDWLFHAWLPLIAYAGLAGGAAGLLWRPHEALFGVGASVLLLLGVGVHNSWDIVTYHIFVNLRRTDPGPLPENKS